MTTANLTNFVRFVKQARTEPMSILATAAAAVQADSLMLAAPWRRVAVTVADWPVRNARQDGLSDSYDAAKYVGNYADGTQRAYATMAAYRYELPSGAYALPVAEIVSVTLPLHADRWLVDGVRIAAYLSNDLLPSEDAAYLRTGIAYEAARLIQTDPATDQNESLTLTLPASTSASRYLYIIIALEDYRTTRDFWIEGGALIVGSVTAADFSRDLGTNALTTLPILASNRLRIGGTTLTGPLELATATGLLIEDETLQSNWQQWEGMLRMFSAGAKEVQDVSEATSAQNPWQNLRFTIRYGGAYATGSTIRINVFDTNLMNGTPTAVGIINTPAAFPLEDAPMTIINGEVTPGEKWFWVFVDNEGTGEYRPGNTWNGTVVTPPTNMPAGMGRAQVGPEQHDSIQVSLYESAPPGYLRIGWQSNAERVYGLRIAAIQRNGYYPNGTPIPLYLTMLPRDGSSGQPLFIGREYCHEGDFIAYTENGYLSYYDHTNGLHIVNPVYDPALSGWNQDNPVYSVEGGTSQTYTLAGAPFVPLATPSIESPTGTVASKRPVVQWNSGTAAKFSTFKMQLRRQSDQVVIIDTTKAAPAIVAGKYQYGIDDNLPDGTYEIRIQTRSPGTPNYTSAWSNWASFTVAYSAPESEAVVVAAGLKLTAPGTGEALGWGNCVLRGHAHIATTVSQLKFATAIPPTGMVKVRLVAYLEAAPPYRAGGAPANDTFYGTQTLLPAQWYNGDLWRGTATELQFVAESHPTGTATVTPILVVDLDPMGYDANHPFSITPVELAGPFNLYFFASPVGLYNAALSTVGEVDELHGLEGWSPTLLTLS